MHSSTIILATFAAAVSATLPLPHLRHIEARQTTDAPSPTNTDTSSEDDACYSAAESFNEILSSAPTPPADLLSYAEDNTDFADDPCSVNLPSSLSSEWNSYTSEIYSWYSATLTSAASSVLDECVSTTFDASDYEIPTCTTDASVGASNTGSSGVASASATTTESGASGMTTATTGSTTTAAGGSSATAQTTTTATAGAVPREAGAVGAVLAGVLGVVMAL